MGGVYREKLRGTQGFHVFLFGFLTGFLRVSCSFFLVFDGVPKGFSFASGMQGVQTDSRLWHGGPKWMGGSESLWLGDIA